MPKLYLIHGYIGAGKTTFAKQLEVESGAVRFSLDDWMEELYGTNPPVELFGVYEARVKALIVKVTEGVLRRGVGVILDFGFWKRVERDALRAWGRSLGAEVVLYDVQVPEKVALARVRARNEAGGAGVLLIDDAAFFDLRKQFEPLGMDEARVAVGTE